MKLVIRHSGGVATAYVDDDASPEEIKRVIFLALNVEEGNGDGKVRLRPNQVKIQGCHL